MTFRIEEKLLIHPYQLFDFNKWKNSLQSKRLYPPRIIQSIYFDNIDNKMFLDSEEGCVPRKKIRVRNYINSQKDQNNYFEKKISSVEGRFKTSKKISKKSFNKIMNFGYLDNNYGICLPKIKIRYHREYHEVLKTRLTIDTNIIYNEYNKNNIVIKDNLIVVEIKQNKNANLSKLYNDFPFPRSRFSKYCRAYLRLNN